MKTLDWSVETLGREWNLTELLTYFNKARMAAYFIDRPAFVIKPTFHLDNSHSLIASRSPHDMIG